MKEKEVMTSTVTNQSHTMVSFRGNSGETWHIPPGHAITIMTIELTDNEKVRKLEELGFIAIQHRAPEKNLTAYKKSTEEHKRNSASTKEQRSRSWHK
jgi:hypothetical protein